MSNVRFHFFAAISLLLSSQITLAVENPDQVTVFFPPFSGGNNIGKNVATVLSLQLAQTGRKAPWPFNPEQHDFGQGLIRWGNEVMVDDAISTLNKAAQKLDLLAQIVVIGKAARFGPDVVVELDILLPQYQKATPEGCVPTLELKCDYRQRNFEIWSLKLNNAPIELDVPKRYFRLSTIVLKPSIVEQFSAASGLPIHQTINSSKILGITDEHLQFIEFNSKLPGAPTKLRSGGVEGYVSLPELSKASSEFSDMVGGVWQVFRGDWERAIKSFSQVIENPQTRVPLKIDALLYRGMAQFREGGNGLADIQAAVTLAPFDDAALRYLLMAHLSLGAEKQVITAILQNNGDLFPPNDRFINKLKTWLATIN